MARRLVVLLLAVLALVGGLAAHAATPTTAHFVTAAEGGGDSLITVRHYTSDLGRSQIGESGGLRAGTYVTRPGDIPAGTSSGGIEKLLEIEEGKGANYVDLQVPGGSLGIPENGSITSGGTWQRILLGPVDLGGAEFLP